MTLTDWQRLLVGRAPCAFLAEVLVRTALIYLVLIIVVKLLGKRLSGQLTNVDLAVMVVLGAIVSAPMQIPQRGLLAGAASLIVLLCLQRAIIVATAVWPRFEQLVFGRGTTLVADGELLLPALSRACVSREQLWGILRSHGVRELAEVERVYLEDGRLHIDALRRNAISREQVFAELRSRGVLQLGAVERVYLESDGTFSMFKQTPARAGLSIVPTWDPGLAAREVHDAQAASCSRCGSRRDGADSTARCKFCHANDWSAATRP